MKPVRTSEIKVSLFEPGMRVMGVRRDHLESKAISNLPQNAKVAIDPCELHMARNRTDVGVILSAGKVITFGAARAAPVLPVWCMLNMVSELVATITI